MTKPKYQNGIIFFENILNNMQIDSYLILPNKEWLIYQVNTTTSKKVLFTDEYMITIEFINNVKNLLKSGDCIYLMGIWQNITDSAAVYANELGIKIGNSKNISHLIYQN